MPSAWPNGGSALPKVLEGDTAQQLAAIWLYLSEGTKATVPYGYIGWACEPNRNPSSHADNPPRRPS